MKNCKLIAILAAALPLGGCIGAAIEVGAAVVTGGISGLTRANAQVRQAAQAMYWRAGNCIHYVEPRNNGALDVIVHEAAFHDSYDAGNGTILKAKEGTRLAVVRYELISTVEYEALVTPDRRALSSPDGDYAFERGDNPNRLRNVLRSGEKGYMLPPGGRATITAVFDVSPGEYAVTLPRCQKPEGDTVHAVAGCVFKPAAA